MVVISCNTNSKTLNIIIMLVVFGQLVSTKNVNGAKPTNLLKVAAYYDADGAPTNSFPADENDPFQGSRPVRKLTSASETRMVNQATNSDVGDTTEDDSDQTLNKPPTDDRSFVNQNIAEKTSSTGEDTKKGNRKQLNSFFSDESIEVDFTNTKHSSENADADDVRINEVTSSNSIFQNYEKHPSKAKHKARKDLKTKRGKRSDKADKKYEWYKLGNISIKKKLKQHRKPVSKHQRQTLSVISGPQNDVNQTIKNTVDVFNSNQQRNETGSEIDKSVTPAAININFKSALRKPHYQLGKLQTLAGNFKDHSSKPTAKKLHGHTDRKTQLKNDTKNDNRHVSISHNGTTTHHLEEPQSQPKDHPKSAKQKFTMILASRNIFKRSKRKVRKSSKSHKKGINTDSNQSTTGADISSITMPQSSVSPQIMSTKLDKTPERQNDFHNVNKQTKPNASKMDKKPIKRSGIKRSIKQRDYLAHKHQRRALNSKKAYQSTNVPDNMKSRMYFPDKGEQQLKTDRDQSSNANDNVQKPITARRKHTNSKAAHRRSSVSHANQDVHAKQFHKEEISKNTDTDEKHIGQTSTIHIGMRKSQKGRDKRQTRRLKFKRANHRKNITQISKPEFHSAISNERKTKNDNHTQPINADTSASQGKPLLGLNNHKNSNSNYKRKDRKSIKILLANHVFHKRKSNLSKQTIKNDRDRHIANKSLRQSSELVGKHRRHSSNSIQEHINTNFITTSKQQLHGPTSNEQSKNSNNNQNHDSSSLAVDAYNTKELLKLREPLNNYQHLRANSKIADRKTLGSSTTSQKFRRKISNHRVGKHFTINKGLRRRPILAPKLDVHHPDSMNSKETSGTINELYNAKPKIQEKVISTNPPKHVIRHSSVLQPRRRLRKPHHHSVNSAFPDEKSEVSNNLSSSRRPTETKSRRAGAHFYRPFATITHKGSEED